MSGPVKTAVNLPVAGYDEQAKQAARFISVNNRLTFSQYGTPSVRLATLPVSEKPAASAKCWYLLSSWFAPAPGEPRPDGRRGGRTKRPGPPAFGHLQARIPSPTQAPRLPNGRATPPSHAFAPLHAVATLLGDDVSGSFRWQAKTPHHEGVLQSPCSRPRSPRGLVPFWRRIEPPEPPSPRLSHVCAGPP